MLDDAVVVLGKAELAERVVERAARGDEKHRDVQPAAGLRRFLSFGHRFSSTARESSAAGRRKPDADQPMRLSPCRLMRTSRWMPTFISRPKPSITVTIAVPP